MGNVILIGFMGSGKTTVGLKLSYRLRRTMVDTDKEIERKEKRAISDIFATDGEAYFRQRETECLQRLIDTAGNQIISVGGGLPLREENRALLRKLGQIFYLRAQAETIYERLKDDTSRPLLNVDDPKTRIQALLQEREPYYRKAADTVVDVDGKGFEQIVSEIEARMERQRGKGERNENTCH